MKVTAPEMTSYAGATVSIGSTFTLTQCGVIAGIVTALLTFALNLWYTRKKNAHEQALIDHQIRLAASANGPAAWSATSWTVRSRTTRSR